MLELLPWLNLLLVPVMATTWRISALLAKIEQQLVDHDRRLVNLEQARLARLR